MLRRLARAIVCLNQVTMIWSCWSFVCFVSKCVLFNCHDFPHTYCRWQAPWFGLRRMNMFIFWTTIPMSQGTIFHLIFCWLSCRYSIITITIIIIIIITIIFIVCTVFICKLTTQQSKLTQQHIITSLSETQPIILTSKFLWLIKKQQQNQIPIVLCASLGVGVVIIVSLLTPCMPLPSHQSRARPQDIHAPRTRKDRPRSRRHDYHSATLLRPSSGSCEARR